MTRKRQRPNVERPASLSRQGGKSQSIAMDYDALGLSDEDEPPPGAREPAFARVVLDHALK
eukprot:4691506-Prymnesium_polylepis.1